MGSLALAVFLLAGASATMTPAKAPASPSDLDRIQVGTAAPDFALPDHQGESVHLSDLRGHPTLLLFYRGHW